MSLNNIIFENIDEEYAYAKYADFTVIMMKKNRYINATRLCNEYGKKLDKWTRTDRTKELIDTINNKINEEAPTIQIKSKKHNSIIRGTYVHPLLIDKIIDWCKLSPTKQNEKLIAIKLNEKLKGSIEVPTPIGRIDILTDTEIIEIKTFRHWKSAIGQIISYGYFYPTKIKRIHLFDFKNENIITIKNICTKYNIKLTYE
jgi:hypothetical protein